MADLQLGLQAASVLGVLLTCIGAFIGILVSLRNGRTALAIATRGKENAAAIQEIHITMNGKLAELLRVSIALARAEARAEALDEKASQAQAENLIEPKATARAAAAVIEAADIINALSTSPAVIESSDGPSTKQVIHGGTG